MLFAAAGLQGAPSRLPLAAAAAPAPAATAAKLAGTLCTYPCNNYTLAATHLHVHTSTCRLLLLQQLHLQQLQQNLQQQYALTPATTLHTCTCTSYTLALHVGTRTSKSPPGELRRERAERWHTESRRRCMRGRRRDNLSVNGGWILKSGVSILMALVNLSPSQVHQGYQPC